jgi:transcriptional regulator with XRE-family HTH domain
LRLHYTAFEELHMADPIELEALGVKVRRLRVDKGLTQDRLAILAHVDQSALSKFERSRGRLGEIPLRRIATVLAVSFEELVANTEL